MTCSSACTMLCCGPSFASKPPLTLTCNSSDSFRGSHAFQCGTICQPLGVTGSIVLGAHTRSAAMLRLPRFSLMLWRTYLKRASHFSDLVVPAGCCSCAVPLSSPGVLYTNGPISTQLRLTYSLSSFVWSSSCHYSGHWSDSNV